MQQRRVTNIARLMADLCRHAPAVVVIAAALTPRAALAQRAQDNATTESADAFGRQVGTESTGLYSDNDVRGFSPIDAGNARVEGLYFDQLDGFPSSILESTVINVGLSSQGFFFPAPTGIIDYQILRPASTLSGNVTAALGPYSTRRLFAELSVPLTEDGSGLLGSFEARHRQRPDGRRENSLNYGLVAEWLPYSGANVVLFGGGNISRDNDANIRIFTSGDHLPPRIERGQQLGQPWAEGESTSSIFGVIARLPLSQRYQLEISGFRNRETADSLSDVFSEVSEDGRVGRRTVIVDRARPRRSHSGEVRLVRAWQGWGIAHRLAASGRLRRQHRAFGGAPRVDLGESTILAPDFRPMPEFVPGERSTDEVSQITYGLAYSAMLGDRATFDAGLSRSDYSKFVDFADPMSTDVETLDTPILWNLSGSVRVLPGVTAYAGLTRGLEDASIAPDFAVNRDVAPPAIHTRQEDASLRWDLADNMSLILGVFQISKPYYNLDAVNRYRLLGEVSTRGVELSLAGQLFPGLSVVLGTVLMDPSITGEVVESGAIGARPVGSIRRKSVLNADWRLQQGQGAWSFDLGVESNSRRVANALNTFSAPSTFIVDLGARYRFAAYGLDMVVRPRMRNLFNQYTWDVSSGGSYSYSERRRFSLELITDF